jgi:SAM-dependent methyltransferase
MNTEQFSWDASMLDYYQTHKLRFEQSLSVIKPIVTDKSDVLEIGTPHVFTDVFKSECVVNSFTNTNQDLRTPLKFSDDTFDLVLCMEVIEHIKDSEENGFNDTFRGNGQRQLIKECFRVLRPGGKLFLTTPNLNSMRSLQHWISNIHTFTYWHHVRELSVIDLNTMLETAGFEIELFESKASWYQMTPTDRSILKVLAPYGVSDRDREDNLFVVSSK